MSNTCKCYNCGKEDYPLGWELVKIKGKYVNFCEECVKKNPKVELCDCKNCKEMRINRRVEK